MGKRRRRKAEDPVYDAELGDQKEQTMLIEKDGQKWIGKNF